MVISVRTEEVTMLLDIGSIISAKYPDFNPTNSLFPYYMGQGVVLPVEVEILMLQVLKKVQLDDGE